MAARGRVVLGGALILMFAGSTSSTVYREVVYKDNACTTENYTAEFFGIPDSVGLQDLGACIPNTDSSINGYIEYECINSSVVAGMYSDASCTDPVEGVASAEVTNGICTRNTRRSCSTTDPSTSASHNFTISTKYFKSSPSCLERNMVMETKHDTQEFRHPLTKSTSECTWSENVLFGFNSKLACVDGELKTFYYEASDMRCMSSPKAVVDSPSCMKVDSVDLYHKLSCKDPSSSEKVPVVAPPPLDRDSSADDMTYFHVRTYYRGDNDTGSCSVLESEQYYSAYPGEEPGMSLKFGECGEYGGGYFAMTECDEDSGAISVSLHLGGMETTDQCSPETVVTQDDDVYKSGSCMDSKKRMCTATAPTYENMIDDWDVLLEYHEDDICSSSTGKKESVDWMEIPRSSLNDGSSVDYEISFVYEKAMESKSCSTNGRYKTELNCVDGTVKLFMFPGEDTNCSSMPLMVSQIPSCLAMEDEGEYAKMSCYGMFTSSAHHLSKPLWLFGSTITTVIMVLLFTSATGNF